MPRALILGVSIVTLVYVAVSVVFLYLVPPDRIAADDQAFAALAGDALFGRRGEVIFSIIVIISVAGSLAAVLMASPRVYFAMARDGLFFASFAAVDPRRDVPARATAVQATLAAALALTGSFDQILSYFMVPTLCVPGAHSRRDLRPGSPQRCRQSIDDTARLPDLSPALLDSGPDCDSLTDRA